MGMRILRRILAAQDSESIANYIAKNSLETALRFLENTESTLQELAGDPERGKPFLSDEPQLADLKYERVKGFPNHFIFYVQHAAAIEVVRIMHGARNLDVELKRT